MSCVASSRSCDGRKPARNPFHRSRMGDGVLDPRCPEAPMTSDDVLPRLDGCVRTAACGWSFMCIRYEPTSTPQSASFCSAGLCMWLPSALTGPRPFAAADNFAICGQEAMEGGRIKGENESMELFGRGKRNGAGSRYSRDSASRRPAEPAGLVRSPASPHPFFEGRSCALPTGPTHFSAAEETFPVSLHV